MPFDSRRLFGATNSTHAARMLTFGSGEKNKKRMARQDPVRTVLMKACCVVNAFILSLVGERWLVVHACGFMAPGITAKNALWTVSWL